MKIFHRRSKRKASLELSIRSIVIVVLAMTLLGLGLGFVRSMFSNIEKVSAGAFAKIEDQLNNELITGDKNLVFSKSKLTIERKKSSIEGFGVKNSLGETLKYGAKFSVIDCPTNLKKDGTNCPNIDMRKWLTYNEGPEKYQLGPAAQHVKKVSIQPPVQTTYLNESNEANTIDVETGLYLIELTIYTGDNRTIDPDEIYASTEIFLTIA